MESGKMPAGAVSMLIGGGVTGELLDSQDVLAFTGDKHCPDVPSLVFGCDGWGASFCGGG